MFNSIKDKTNNLVKYLTSLDDAHEFKPLLSEIEEAPTSPLSRFMFWTIVALLVITVLWLFFAKVDIVVRARGIVIPDGEAKIIQPFDIGVVNDILVREGDFVKKGQLLIAIDPSTTDAELKSIRQNLSQVSLEARQLKAVSKGNGFVQNPDEKNPEEWQTQKDIYNAKLTALRKEIGVKQLEISKTDEQIRAVQAQKASEAEFLNTSRVRERRLKNVLDVIAYRDYEEAANDVKEHSANMTRLSCELRELNSSRRQIRNEIAQMKADFESQNLQEFAEKQKQVNQLQANEEEILFKNQKQKIVAPCDGYIDKLFLHTVGGVVTPAQKLVQLTPIDKPLLIKAQVLNKDIGFIRKGMPVSIKVDTFDFQKYGILDGKVKSVSQNSVNDEKLGPVYEVYITPITKTFMVEGKEENIATGMTLNAEINISKRRVIDFFIYPLIKYLDEGISVR